MKRKTIREMEFCFEKTVVPGRFIIFVDIYLLVKPPPPKECKPPGKLRPV